LLPLREILNNGVAKKLGIYTNPFVSVELHDSKKFDLMQINDILIGAIGFQKNGYHLRTGTRHAKEYLADYIARQAGLNDLTRTTRYGQRRFKIWEF
jgi:hypothetical protein